MDPNSEISGMDISSQLMMKELVNHGKSEQLERAERQRLEGLNRIEGINMNSNPPIDPIEPFPNEIWKMIVDFTKNPCDQRNLSKAHPLFSELIVSRKTVDTLFHLVLHLEPIMVGLISNFKSDLMELRSVSRSLRDAVDCVIQENLLKKIRTNYDANENQNCQNVLHLSLRTQRQLNRILFSATRMTKAHFFLRSLSIFFVELDTLTFREFQQFTRNILSLLDIIGDQILYLDFSFFEHNFETREFPSEHCYILLQKFVSLMPNLNFLKIHQMTEDTVNEAEALRVQVDRHQFPCLEHLEKISFRGFACGTLTDVMYMAIFEANPHVKFFCIEPYGHCYRHDHKNIEHFPKIQNYPTVNLTELVIRRNISWSLSFPLIQNLLNPNWRLTRLHLSIDMEGSSINVLFSLLNNFPTLEYLHLETESVTIFDDVISLQLPNLLEFRIAFEKANVKMEDGSKFYGFFSTHFLLGSRKLKRLGWTYPKGSYNDKNDKERFWKLLGKPAPLHLREGLLNRWKFRRDLSLMNASIWKLFPCLEYVQIVSVEIIKKVHEITYWVECKKTRFHD